MLRVIDELKENLTDTTLALTEERRLRYKYQAIVRELCALLNKNIIYLALHKDPADWTDPDNVTEHLKAFETSLHAMLLGVNPRKDGS